MIRTLLSLLISVGLASGSAIAAGTACPTHYFKGDAPDINAASLRKSTRELCYLAFGVMHSGVARTSLWSAEHLTREHLLLASHMHRVNSFHADTRLPTNERAELSDYFHSNMDRGHLSPNGDAYSTEAQGETFTLANMVPQSAPLNRGSWVGIETATRELAKKEGDLYVITGPLFQGTGLRLLHGHVLVPSHMWKAIYDPVTGKSGAWLAENTDAGQPTPISVADLEQKIGITLFPGVPANVRASLMDMPTGNQHEFRSGGSHLHKAYLHHHGF